MPYVMLNDSHALSHFILIILRDSVSILQMRKKQAFEKWHGLNGAPPQRYVHVLIPRTYEFYLIWKKGICRCKLIKDFE